MSTLTDLVTLALGSSIGTAAVVWASVKFLRDRAATFADNLIAGRIKKQFDEQLAAFNAALSRLNEQRKIEYGWLYVERAKAMLEIYSNLVTVKNARKAATAAALKSRQLQPSPPKGARKHAEEEFGKFVKCRELLKESFEFKRLLFSDEDDAELSQNLQTMTEYNEDVLRVLRRIIDRQDEALTGSEEFKDVTTKAVQAQADYENTKRIIENKFRKLYGSVLNISNADS
jgi:hypothetical protein